MTGFRNNRQYQTKLLLKPQANYHLSMLPRNQPQFSQIRKERQINLWPTFKLCKYVEDRRTAGQLTTSTRGQREMASKAQFVDASQPMEGNGKKPRVVEQTIPPPLTGLRLLTGRVGKIKEWILMVMY